MPSTLRRVYFTVLMRIPFFLVAAIALCGCVPVATAPDTVSDASSSSTSGATIASSSSSHSIAFIEEEWVEPVASASGRILKKPFGIRVSPDDSPVESERFSGYHTGVDFETLETESGARLVVSASCAGPVIYRDWVSGYGGVVVQTCDLQEKTVTVLYGHLDIETVSATVGDRLFPGERLGELGEGFTAETDGEREHLHFAIHRGESLNVRGYVASEMSLKEWVDPATVLFPVR